MSAYSKLADVLRQYYPGRDVHVWVNGRYHGLFLWSVAAHLHWTVEEATQQRVQSAVTIHLRG